MFLRCFAYGLAEGESVTVTIDGKEVAFSYAEPQIDVQVDSPEAPEAPAIDN